MIVGLTGGIATGKSTVGSILTELGASVIDADQVSRDVVSIGSDALAEIERAFGQAVIQEDGSLDRERLGAIVVNDPTARKRLEAITHPRIRAEIAQRVQAAILGGAPAAFVEAALLVETGSATLYPELWVVVCEPEKQIARLMSRKGCDRATALAWVDAQMPLAEKASHASEVIANDGSLDALQQVVERAYTELMAQQRDRG